MLYKLGSICDVRDGTHDSPVYVEKGYPLVTSKNIVDGKLDLSNINYISEEDYNKINERSKVDIGDIIMPMIGTIGNPYIIKDNSGFAIKNVALIKFPSDEIINKYVWYYLQSPNFKKYVESKNRGGTQKFLSLGDIRNIEIPYISKNEQTNVVSHLDTIFNLINLRKQELLELDNLIKSRFVEMFGTLEKPVRNFRRDTLKELCSKITDGKHGGCTQEEGTKRYFVGAREIYDDIIHYDTAPEIKVAEFEKDYKRCNIEIGDFLIVNTGATIGKSAIATDLRTEYTLLQKSVALLKVKQELLNPVFLMWCYRVNTKMYMVESASAQPNLLLSKINATEIYVPDIGLQKRFADFVTQVTKLKFEVQKSLNETQLLFDSLMQKYFG